MMNCFQTLLSNSHWRRYTEDENGIPLSFRDQLPPATAFEVNLLGPGDSLSGGVAPTIGRVVQVDPMKPTLKAPGTTRLKL